MKKDDCYLGHSPEFWEKLRQIDEGFQNGNLEPDSEGHYSGESIILAYGYEVPKFDDAKLLSQIEEHTKVCLYCAELKKEAIHDRPIWT